MTDFRRSILSLTMERVSVVMNQFPWGKNASIKCLQNNMVNKHHRHKREFKFLFQEYLFHIMEIISIA